MALMVILNGDRRELDGLEEGAWLVDVIGALGLKGDRVAVERNGEIVARRDWGSVEVLGGDKLEVVHFVGGGAGIWLRQLEGSLEQ